MKISRFFLVVTIASSSVLAQTPPSSTGVLRDDPNRPVNAISKDLGVTPDQFRTCFSNVNPASRGAMPEGNQKHANKAVLLICLQKANPSITNDSLDQVMDRYRPGGRAAQ
ncbi:hypothetical protein G6706_03235 [Polynucleobacter paneuropaeus]|nr:hypothetical protein [Polynucleobacter paneuropaeus]MBT8554455.1 hypothetical protein [Polynucleobacter paneuropaeus]MBT8559732.1 hypothetical protein [Polynucleobacter paneuropaeus]QWD34628.1 hypothetical protein G6676_05190 [Polynucleobacter paneuropaeus]